MQYLKPPLTFEKQCEQLIERGLIIRNHAKAVRVLSETNYYRLSAYYLPFLSDKQNHIFYPNVSFEKIVRLHSFDSQLRNIIMPIVEAAEVLMRCRLAYHLVIKYNDPFCYLNKDIYTKKFIGEQIAREDFLGDFSKKEIESIWLALIHNGNIDKKGNIKKRDANNLFQNFNKDQEKKIEEVLNFSAYEEWMNKMRASIRESKEEFVRHYLEKYFDDARGFPLWMVTEVVSFGQLSKLFSGLNSEDKKEIANKYEVSPRIMVSWLHSLVYLRNICAHHSRLWNRILEIRPLKPKGFSEKTVWSERIFPLFIVLKYLTPASFNWDTVVWRLRWLFVRNRFVKLAAMGFSKNWARVLLKRKKSAKLKVKTAPVEELAVNKS